MAGFALFCVINQSHEYTIKVIYTKKYDFGIVSRENFSHFLLSWIALSKYAYKY